MEHQAWPLRRVRTLGVLLGLLLSGVGQAQDIGRVAKAPEPPDESRRAAYRNGILPLPGALGLTGQGIDILVWETDIPLLSHPALVNADIIIEHNVDNAPGTHATGVIGAMVGQGPCQVHGAAPEATIHMFENEAIEVRMQQWEDQLNAGVGLLSNWSFTAGGDEQHVSIETITHAHPEHLLITGTGNPNQNLWRRVSNSHKNALVVGSIDFDHAFSFGNSGRGPTQEGRIKPDLVEFGKSLFMPGIDPMGNVGVVSFQGSSFACALVTGQSALIQESAVELFGAPMRGDELKSTLILCAEDLGPEGPDFQFGFGHMRVDQSLEFISRVHHGCPSVGVSVNELAPGAVDTVSIDYSGEHPLRACLVWMDPTAGLHFRAVIRDLNLTYEAQDGTQTKPWAFPHASVFLENTDSLSLLYDAPAVRAINGVDNVELIDVPISGNGGGHLLVSNGSGAPQSYALTWMEVLPAPWVTPETTSDTLQCLDAGGTSMLFDEGGALAGDGCGSSLPQGAYCLQSTSPDGCHSIQTFEVQCDFCPGDLDGDGFLATSDFLIMLGLLGDTSSVCFPECSTFDLVGNNMMVFVDDLLTFLSLFGTPCP